MCAVHSILNYLIWFSFLIDLFQLRNRSLRISNSLKLCFTFSCVCACVCCSRFFFENWVDRSRCITVCTSFSILILISRLDSYFFTVGWNRNDAALKQKTNMIMCLRINLNSCFRYYLSHEIYLAAGWKKSIRFCCSFLLLLVYVKWLHWFLE